jgi:hypothetical protein
MKTKHTPGPWQAMYSTPIGGESALAVLPGTAKEGEIVTPICKVSPESLENETDRANALLIAAAPENTESNIYMTGVVEKCIAVLQEYIVPDSKLDSWNAINELLGILDNAEIVKGLEFSKTAIAKATGEKEVAV